MVWAPSEENRKAIKFWLDCFQVVAVAGSVLAAAITFANYTQEQKDRAEAEARRVKEQDERAEEQLAAIKRDLQRPYQEKKLNLYLDAARVVAHLASGSPVDKEKTEARFWELYWGELAFVESRTDEEERGGPKPSIERLMVLFCTEYFDPTSCTKLGAAGSTKERTIRGEAAALELARKASKEIRDDWEKIGK
jgi:hypothetical protein